MTAARARTVFEIATSPEYVTTTAYFAPGPSQWRAFGRHFGYPECCIEAFVADALAGRSPAQLRGTNADGCVPCPLCAGPLARSHR